MTYSTPSARWRAIVNRDASATNFVYGVRTTKIYCRPRCPARLARRANVIFYDTPEQAERAGYRPCKRCKPEDLLAPMDPHIKLAQKACETMTLAALATTKQRPTLTDLAAEAGLTPSHFHRVFKKVVGVTPGKFSRDLREGKTTFKRLDGESVRAVMDKSSTTGHLFNNNNIHHNNGSGGGSGSGSGSGNSNSNGMNSLGNMNNNNGQVFVTGGSASGNGTSVEMGTENPESIRIDWNEFDRLLVAEPPGGGGGRVHIGNNLQDSSAFFIPGVDDDPLGDHSPVLGESTIFLDHDSEQQQQQSSSSSTSRAEGDIGGFTEHVNDVFDFSFKSIDSDFDNNNKARHHLHLHNYQQNQNQQQNASGQSSEHSLTPVETPPFVDTFSSMAASPLLFDDVGWYEDNGGFPSYPLSR